MFAGRETKANRTVTGAKALDVDGGKYDLSIVKKITNRQEKLLKQSMEGPLMICRGRSGHDAKGWEATEGLDAVNVSETLRVTK